MPPIPNGVARDPMVDSHEHRIARLEADSTTLQASVEGLSVTAEHTQSDLVKLDGKVDKLDGKVDALDVKMDTLHEAIRETATKAQMGLQQIHQDDQIQEAEKKATWGMAFSVLKKLAVPIAVAATALITKLGEALWTWLSGFHHG